ncbi:hypothetical protein [Marinomonas sp. GJ51-6]|uniref:hypothetical protein n=1 Tax=Marinomonas sp. GJ51-6 TaxID=2992802 RepID=UPI002934AE8A|nr:hypothetical protein [Marinomonas sp. GJ51-6]WOD08734.1 hypothetical protein ONZ50_06575 [Marinomonas sp. GJ51-6]
MKWTDVNRNPQGFTPLRAVLNFEEFLIEDSFINYVPIYADEFIKGLDINLSDLYSAFEPVKGFDTWVRSFYDLHQVINRGGDINFYQSRILDALLVITIRTEIVLRGVFYHYYSCEKYDLKDVLNGILYEG